MTKRRFKQRILSLEKRVKEHEEKAANEKSKPNPDEGLIAHWEREIKAFRKSIEEAKKRLGGKE